MAHNDFSISITDKMVDVRYTPSESDPRGKLFGFIFIISTLVVLACALLFLPGKHGNPSMWHDLASAPTGSSGFLILVIGLMLFIGLFGWQGFCYARAAWASDETFTVIAKQSPYREYLGSISPIEFGARTPIRLRK